MRRVCLTITDEAAAILEKAGGSRGRGEYLSRLLERNRLEWGKELNRLTANYHSHEVMSLVVFGRPSTIQTELSLGNLEVIAFLEDLE